jgi:integrase
MIAMQTIEQWLNVLKANGRSAGTIRNYRNVLTRLQTYKPLDRITKQDLVDYFANSNIEDATKVLWAIVIKKFFKEQGKTEIVDWLKVKKPKETLREEDIPTPADINKMIDATDSPYWKANIAVSFETGGRAEEILNIRWKDIKDYKVTIDNAERTFMSVQLYDFKSKQYRQPVIIPFSEQYIKNLKAYKGGKPDDRVFDKSYSQTWAIFVHIGKDAGLPMQTNPHVLRHASATEMERRGFSDSAIRKKHGWTPTSTTPARYKHLTNTDVINETLVRNGVLTEKKLELINLKITEPNPVIDTAQLMLDLKAENQQLKADIGTLHEMVVLHNEDISKIGASYIEEMSRLSSENQELKQGYEIIKQLKQELEELKKAKSPIVA